MQQLSQSQGRFPPTYTEFFFSLHLVAIYIYICMYVLGLDKKKKNKNTCRLGVHVVETACKSRVSYTH